MQDQSKKSAQDHASHGAWLPLNRIHPERKINKKIPHFPCICLSTPRSEPEQPNKNTTAQVQLQMPTSRQRHACQRQETQCRLERRRRATGLLARKPWLGQRFHLGDRRQTHAHVILSCKPASDNASPNWNGNRLGRLNPARQGSNCFCSLCPACCTRSAAASWSYHFGYIPVGRIREAVE